jgi:hypothetical protein
MKRLLPALFLLTACVSQTPAPPAAPDFPAACRESCAAPWGERLGAAGGVPAFSNCQPACVYEKPSEVNGTFAGIQWQCVEYARRWLIVARGLTFPSIDFAADLWALDHFVKVGPTTKVPARKVENGAAAIPPSEGDLLVYGREFKGTGHLAVVVKVDPKRRVLRVGEENYLNKPWPADYSREIPYVERAGKVWVLDAYLLGWKTTK